MAQVDVTINNRSYRIACDDGQEEHLVGLAEFVDRRVRDLAEAVGQVGDARLLVMASLLISDELSEAYESKTDAPELGASSGSLAASMATEPSGISEDLLAEITEKLAERLENIAVQLEPA
jgi:cell division protein ZapA